MLYIEKIEKLEMEKEEMMAAMIREREEKDSEIERKLSELQSRMESQMANALSKLGVQPQRKILKVKQGTVKTSSSRGTPVIRPRRVLPLLRLKLVCPRPAMNESSEP